MLGLICWTQQAEGEYGFSYVAGAEHYFSAVIGNFCPSSEYLGQQG
jgi:hypothetical protein